MPVVLLLAALVILAGVVAVAIGRGGELTMFRPDSPRYPQVLASAADVASFRPPLAFFGYSAPATDEALQQITQVVVERDAEVAWLRDQVVKLGGDAGDWPSAAPPPQPRPEPASWPDEWTYAGRERRAEPADWAGHEERAEAEAEPEPEPEAGTAQWSDSGWSDTGADTTGKEPS
jgi:hypothetical protein